MVALMKFTRDICRLLGLGSVCSAHSLRLEKPIITYLVHRCVTSPQATTRVTDPSSAMQPPGEQMDCSAATLDPGHDATLTQDALNGEEDVSEEEKLRRKVERRKAKRKRRRKKKKQEQIKKTDSAEQDDEEDCAAESELDDSESEADVVPEDEKQAAHKEGKKEIKPTAVPTTVISPAENKGQQKTKTKSSEEEPEWDVSSAFFAHAVSHIKPKGASRKSKENKENEAKRETNGTDSMTKKSASLTEKGIKLVQQGEYAQAASMFTEAIKCDPKDYRFFGNRSYCYCCLELYSQALADAERSIQLDPGWPKGYFRKGNALMGLKRYSEAEKAMEQVLKLDEDCEEAENDLFYCKVQQLMELGFEETQSIRLLESFSTVQAVLASCSDAAKAGSQDPSVVQPGPCPSLWVGNVTTELTEKHLWDLFKIYGEIESIRVLHERFCAFVNFRNANMAARAMEKLNGHCIENTRLVVRYPDRRAQRILPVPLKSVPVSQQAGAAVGPRRRGPVNGDECYFWRTTGCHFGDKCRYKHIPDQKGKDRKPWQP
ncbi:tetratricopeptide repeat protein 31 isoform X2 [Oryzias latipes]|uniref:tetratricopeptide repeat protein 31 isoform X2 n=1 Tax=Oryzias latipes TaxID=8090 RepID=UPI0009DB63FA|nr:tetratricopeptide repeat protein 31 isoform X2 [Oryzias latipes]